MKESNYNYWFRTSLGLENTVLDELREKVKINKYLTAHRSVFIGINKHIKNEQEFFKQIKTADDVYKFIDTFRGIDKTKLSIDKFFVYFKKNIIPIIKKNKKSIYFRVTASFIGKRNFNRFFVENALNKLVATHTNFKILSSERDDPRKKNELRLRCHIEDDQIFLGMAIFDTPLHRKEWRTHSYNAQLHPPIAGVMIKIATKFNAKKIIDPFCGSGTILIESAINNPSINHCGFDTNTKAINIAKKHAKLAIVDIDFYNKNAFDPTISYDGTVIVSNPPWGNKYKIKKNKNESFIYKLKEIILKSSGAILVVPEDLANQLKNEGLHLKETLRTRIKGKIALIVIFRKY